MIPADDRRLPRDHANSVAQRVDTSHAWISIDAEVGTAAQQPAAKQPAVWLAGPEAESAFDPRLQSPADAARYLAITHPQRHQDWAVSRALLAALTIPVEATWSLSHSHGFAAVGVSETGDAVGVDVETIRPKKVLALARFAFTEREHTALAKLSADDQLLRFFALWTLKEASAKALQLDLFTALRECEFLLGDAAEKNPAHGCLPTSASWSARVYLPAPAVILATVTLANT